MEHRLAFEQLVPCDLASAFAFFADAHNLEKITPPFLRFRIVRVEPEPVRAGTLIDYELRLHGLPMRWRSRIDEWDPPRRFVDVQVRGPYRVWHHTHELEATRGGTLVRDRIAYVLPFGALGRLIAGRLVAHDLDEIFRYRRARIAELLG